MRLPIPQKAQEQFMRDTGLAAHSAEHSWRWVKKKNGGQDSVGGFGELTKKGDPWWVPILHSTYPRDPGSPKLRMVENGTTKYDAFWRWLYTPIIIYENMTGFRGLRSRKTTYRFSQIVKQWDELEQVWKKPWIMFHVWMFAIQVVLFGGNLNCTNNKVVSSQIQRIIWLPGASFTIEDLLKQSHSRKQFGYLGEALPLDMLGFHPFRCVMSNSFISGNFNLYD